MGSLPYGTDVLASLRDHERAEVGSLPDAALVITRQSEDGRRWYASLRGRRWPSDADFATCRETREETIAACASKIRDDMRGVGKFAPHFDAYSLLYQFLPAWREAMTEGEVSE